MKAVSLFLFLPIIFFSCSKQRNFNIELPEFDFSFLDMTDSLKAELEAEVDIIMNSKAHLIEDLKFQKLFKDSLFVELFEKKIFNPAVNELNKPALVKNIEKESIHLIIYKIDSSYILEMEIQDNELLLRKNFNEIILLKTDDSFRDRLTSACDCDETDSISILLKTMSIEAMTLCRADITSQGKYRYCWKNLKDNKTINELTELAKI
jgi:hypothetical protein